MDNQDEEVHQPQEVYNQKNSEEYKEIESQWIVIQNELKTKHITHDQIDWVIPNNNNNSNSTSTSTTTSTTLKYVGGVDISFVKDNDEDACASLIILEYPSLKVVHKEMEFVKLDLPYIPGFLAFRECPSLTRLIDRVKTQHPRFYPQVLLVDGNGFLHPRAFGLACHLGVLCDLPTIGIGKTFFHVDGLDTKAVKTAFSQQCKQAGDHYDLTGDSGTVWGSAVLSHINSKNPIFVSVGHRLSLASSLQVVQACTTSNRIPEPVRQADLLSRDFIRKNYKPSPIPSPTTTTTATTTSTTTTNE
ncbi:endonuclease V [Cavenderia fasciculata]|uniref:Endonuclease V n=1 Tax=Cavenderia fasciculata TaxID=261658 RepID=F4PGG6_CACFS|nr:endonuclease V [Cavenderia fasciculata]EGG24800.1 endonuclease V [Cavenderia fasciculata]|eukprot:XP_004362651.1 endonuclease V [Cavenderia fasciculata]